MPALKVWVANERLTSADLNANFTSVVGPDGVVASAPINATVSTPIPLTAVVEGKASYLSGGRIVTPRAGLYLVSGYVTIGVTAGGGPGTLTIVGTPFTWDVQWSGPTRVLFAIPIVLAAGTQITMSFTQATGTAQCTVHRVGFLFLGTGYAP